MTIHWEGTKKVQMKNQTAPMKIDILSKGEIQGKQKASPSKPTQPEVDGQETGKTNQALPSEKRQREDSVDSVDLDKLGIAWEEKKPSHAQKKQATKEGAPESRDEEVYTGVGAEEVARRMGVKTGSKLYPLLKRLHRRISNGISYPDILIEQNRTGRVRVEVKVKADGTLANQSMEVHAEDRFLSFYVIDQLREALKTPLSDNLRLPMEELRIAIQFHFATYPTRAAFPEKRMPIAKNQLNVYQFAIRTSNPLRARRTANNSLVLELDGETTADLASKLFSDSREDSFILRRLRAL